MRDLDFKMVLFDGSFEYKMEDKNDSPTSQFVALRFWGTVLKCSLHVGQIQISRQRLINFVWTKAPDSVLPNSILNVV